MYVCMQALSAGLALDLAGQRWQTCASAAVGSVIDWGAQLSNHGISTCEECNDDAVCCNYVPGTAEKTIRSPQGALHVRGVTALHLRLFWLVNSGRAAKFTATAQCDDGEAMWNALLNDSSFESRTMPSCEEAVFHRVDCGRRSASANRETTTEQFSMAVGNWFTR